MPRVQIDDQIIELTDEEAEAGGFTSSGMSDYQSPSARTEEKPAE